MKSFNSTYLSWAMTKTIQFWVELVLQSIHLTKRRFKILMWRKLLHKHSQPKTNWIPWAFKLKTSFILCLNLKLSKLRILTKLRSKKTISKRLANNRLKMSCIHFRTNLKLTLNWKGCLLRIIKRKKMLLWEWLAIRKTIVISE